MNIAPAGFALERDLPAGFGEYLLPLHEQFTPRQQSLSRARALRLERAHQRELPTYLPASEATTTDWSIVLPSWCQDQRNQMTGPADDAELVVKLLNSGAPGVMLDLEDSMANTWDHLMLGHRNLVSALYGELTYDDAKRGKTVGIEPSKTVVWNRVRGLHMSQVLPLRHPQADREVVISASLFDLALLTYLLDYSRLTHPLCIYIPKSESAEEARWWRDVFDAIIAAKGWETGSIKCMALIEAHPIAYEMEEFLFNLREYILGLNLGRWDYMASLAHFNLHDPNWILPDRNTIPFDVPFFQNLRTLMPEITHKHGALAIGGMTALFPDRSNPEFNARALDVLERDKKNEADCLMDGAWTGHPDQNEIAVAQFPFPNQLERRPHLATVHPDLRPAPVGVGTTTLDGTRTAVRTVIRYRHGVLNGLGASLLDGYMEDLATDRIYRVMIAQRLRFPGPHTPTSLGEMFDEETARLGPEFAHARDISERMILTGEFDPK
jgi:malate synthase